MSTDRRDSLWEVAFETYYDSYYEEVAAGLLISRWQVLDELAKVVVALTAAGSAVAGWALWSEPGFKVFWAALAGTGALLSIIHAALGVPGRLKTWGEIERTFTTLRIDLETFRMAMDTDPEFDLDGFQHQFEQFRKRYAEAVHQVQNDVLLTGGLRNKAQDQLNSCLADKIVQ